MGIFEAEVRGRTGEEDKLTSRVFGTLEIVDRWKFLAPILRQCGVELGDQIDPSQFTFSYWKTLGKRTPDVVLESKSVLISIENKLGATLDSRQLVEEYEDGNKAKKDFWQIAITADYVEPGGVREAKNILRDRGVREPRICWDNWQRIYGILHNNTKLGNETETKLMDDLLSLLEAKGLSTFVQFNVTLLESVGKLWPEVPRFLEDCSTFFGTLSSRLHEKGITCIERTYAQEIVQTGYKATVLQDYAHWLPRFIGMRAWDNEWKEKEASQGLLILFRLSPLELNVGYRLSLGGNARLLQMFSEAARKCGLAEKLRTIDNCTVSYYDGDYGLLDRVVRDSLSEDTFSLEALRSSSSVIIGRAFDQKEMAQADLVDEILKCLPSIRDIIKESALYFSRDTIDSFTPNVAPEEEAEQPPSGALPPEQV